MLLCRVVEGCIQFTFQVPSFVQQKIFPLSKEQEKALAAMGVIASIIIFHFTEKKHKHDPDNDSDMGSSMFTDTKSTTFSEVTK